MDCNGDESSLHPSVLTSVLLVKKFDAQLMGRPKKRKRAVELPGFMSITSRSAMAINGVESRWRCDEADGDPADGVGPSFTENWGWQNASNTLDVALA